jgi:HSP20 family protein
MAPEHKNRTAKSSTMSRRDIRSEWGDQLARFFNSWGIGASGNRIGDWDMWSPQVETFLRGDQLVIRADLPGLSKEDVQVEVTDDSIILQGERRNEFSEEREGFYRTERSYGSFYRAIPLPEGAIADNAQAAFKDGVLEITMPAPPREAARGRRIEING